MRISCLLLAAGQSSRMGGVNKLMLKIGDTSLVRRTLNELNHVSLFETVVVTGFESDALKTELNDLQAHFVFNPHYARGMHSSIRAGLMALSACDAFFITLADQPFFDHRVLTQMIEEFQGGILYPSFEGQRGQPVLISSKYKEEILREPDGDYGCSYLLKRHPLETKALPVSSSGILVDIDKPADYRTLIEQASAPVDPVEEFNLFIARLRQEGKSFILATVIEVLGSASARTGSKAVFDDQGKNLLGWVGGGCAERFIGEECLEALKENKTRIVLADLDDEIFGLGVACGGKMRVFLDPVTPSETLSLPELPKFKNELRILSGHYGWKLQHTAGAPAPETVPDLLVLMARSMAGQRGHTGLSLREIKKVPATFTNALEPALKEVTIVGRTRITEALARHFSLLSYAVRVVGPDLKAQDYPSTVKCSCLDESYETIEFKAGEVVIVASHTSQDPQIVEKALKQKASYVGMVGSFKRSVEVLTHLGLMNRIIASPLYVPAGLDLGAKNPDEIALSIVAEVILESKGFV